MKNQKGFSLIELLIVVVIIGIIAAIAIPNLIAARRAANEGSAQSVSRTLHSSQVTYQSTTGGGDFAAALPDLQAAALIDATLGAGEKSGYRFDTERITFQRGVRPASFGVNANPTTETAGVTQTGTRSFCVVTDGVMFQYKPATAGVDAPLNTIDVSGDQVLCQAAGATVVE